MNYEHFLIITVPRKQDIKQTSDIQKATHTVTDVDLHRT